jgi:hypothetical protein
MANEYVTTTNTIEVLTEETSNAVVSSVTIQVLRTVATAIEIGNGITIDPGVQIGVN